MKRILMAAGITAAFTAAGLVAACNAGAPWRAQVTVVVEPTQDSPKPDGSVAEAQDEEARGPAPVAELKETTDSIEYDKYLVSEYIEKYIKPNMDAYGVVFDAVNDYESTVDVSEFNLQKDDAIALSRALTDRAEFYYLRSIALSDDGSSLEISYSGDEESAKASTELFRDKVQQILEDNVESSYNQLERVLALHVYIAQNTRSSLDNGGAYDVIVSGKGSSAGYAAALAYLLDQVGIENHITYASDATHVWNIVNIDGAYYQLDAMMESSRSDGRELFNFGMTDARRQMSGGYSSWYCGNQTYFTYDAPKCLDDRFDFLLYATDITLDLDNHALYYTDVSDGARYAYDTLNGLSTPVDPKSDAYSGVNKAA